MKAFGVHLSGLGLGQGAADCRVRPIDVQPTAYTLEVWMTSPCAT
jgi:hypothetical protein